MGAVNGIGLDCASSFDSVQPTADLVGFCSPVFSA